MNLTSPAELLLNVRNLARAQREGEAVDLLTQALTQSDLSDADRAALLSARAELHVHRFQLDAAEDALRALAEVAPTRAAVESMWLHYYRADLPVALAKTRQHQAEVLQWRGYKRARADLMFGKILCEAYLLDDARTWLLHGLEHARAIANNDLLAACAGALAEVYYRGGAVIPALELIELDAALLVHGSQHINRLRTYRAHCYRQLGQTEAARSLYEEARQAAAPHSPSAAYPTRGLLWCDVLDLASGANRPTLLARIDAHLDALRTLGEPHSLGHGLLGASWAMRACGHTEQARQRLDEAVEVFARALLTHEAAWCRTGDFAATNAPRIHTPPPAVSACYEWLASVPLTAPPPRWQAAHHAFLNPTHHSPHTWMSIFF